MRLFTKGSDDDQKSPVTDFTNIRVIASVQDGYRREVLRPECEVDGERIIARIASEQTKAMKGVYRLELAVVGADNMPLIANRRVEFTVNESVIGRDL